MKYLILALLLAGCSYTETCADRCRHNVLLGVIYTSPIGPDCYARCVSVNLPKCATEATNDRP